MIFPLKNGVQIYIINKYHSNLNEQLSSFSTYIVDTNTLNINNKIVTISPKIILEITEKEELGE